jgi:hypothetical protein
MKLLVDTDAFCKLGVAGVLQDAANIFRAGLQECGRLPALPYMLRKGRLRKLYGGEACDALVSVADAMPVVPQPSITWLDKLTLIDDIDPGEAQIFAAAAESGLIVVSGDKRALQALKDVEGFADALAGRIVVLEAVLLALCDQFEHKEIRRRIAPLAASDQIVKVCFSRENQDPREALLSYYRALVADVGPLVLWDPRAGGTI